MDSKTEEREMTNVISIETECRIRFLNDLADERQAYGDIREALELRQKAGKLKRERNRRILETAADSISAENQNLSLEWSR
jgi:hypothetical protein